MRFPAGWESPAFDPDRAPHVVGVINRFWRNPEKRKANLCFASRCQKTSTAIACIMDAAINDPHPMAILFPDEETRDDCLDQQLYPIFEASPPTAEQVPPVRKRNRIGIRFRNCRIRLAVGGIKTSVSGYPARSVFKFEHDKNTLRKSSEADPSQRIETRTAGFSENVKILEEGTPSEIETSRVYKKLTDPNIQRLTWWVKCPHCSQHQPLVFSQLKFGREVDGTMTPMLAKRTAYYECAKCGGRCENHHRLEMLQSGLWVAEGETVEDGQIVGEPTVDSDEMLFGPFSQLGSAIIETWGEIAAQFVTAHLAMERGDIEPMRKFVNEVLGEVWDNTPRTVQPDELAKHLKGRHTKEDCPPDTAFLTCGIDVGAVNDVLIFYWMVCAWARGCRGAVVDWGVCHDRTALDEVLRSSWTLNGQQIGLGAFPIGFDSGNFTTEVYNIVDSIRNAIAMKGDSSSVKSPKVDLYSWGYRTADVNPKLVHARRQAGQGDLLMINTHLSQQWRRSLVERRLKPNQPGFVTIPEDIADDPQFSDFLQQMANDAFVEGKWIKIGPNEAGDCLRINRVLAQYYTRNGRLWDVVQLPKNLGIAQEIASTRSAPRQTPAPRTGGGGFLINQR